MRMRERERERVRSLAVWEGKHEEDDAKLLRKLAGRRLFLHSALHSVEGRWASLWLLLLQLFNFDNLPQSRLPSFSRNHNSLLFP